MSPAVVLRRSRPEQAAALRRLASVDSSRRLHGNAMVPLVGDRAVAAGADAGRRAGRLGRLRAAVAH